MRQYISEKDTSKKYSVFKHMLVSHRAPLILFAKSFHTFVQTMITISKLDPTRQKYNAEKEKNTHKHEIIQQTLQLVIQSLLSCSRDEHI